MIDVIIVAVVFGIIAWSLAVMIKNKKQGKSSCGCDCSKCSSCSACSTHVCKDDNTQNKQ